MSDALRLVVVGGSAASTPELFDAIVDWPAGEGGRPPLEVVLQGRSAEKLAVVADACGARVTADTRVSVRVETDLRTALHDAQFVLVQVRIGGLDARVFDETFPRAFGIPGEETMGPGGFADAVRTVPALADLWDALATEAADAFIINLTNPSGIVSGAAVAHTGLPIVSICDGPVTFVDEIARLVGRAPEDVRRGYAGLNHAGFWVDPDVATLVAALSATRGVDADDVRSLGALPSPYLRFYLHPDDQLAAQRAAAESRAQELKRLEAEMLSQYAGHVAIADQRRRGALWYRVSIVPLVDAVLHGGQQSVVLGLPNQGAVDWAPAEATVELATDVMAGGDLARHAAPAMPGPAADLLRAHATYEVATAEALAGSRTRTDVMARRDRLVEALAANPMVSSEDLAARLVDEILAASPV